MVTPRAVIIGPPGAGKSTVGELLAERLGVSFVDSDTAIEERAGKTISDIFTTDGEAAFRELEQKVIAELLAEHPGVLALGGGAVLATATQQQLRGHPVVLLGVGLSEGFRRTGMSVARPLLAGVNPRATYRELLESRLPIYRAASSFEVDTDERAPEQVVVEIESRLAAASDEETADRGHRRETE